MLRSPKRLCAERLFCFDKRPLHPLPKLAKKKRNGLFEFLMKKLNTRVGDRCCVADRGDQTEAEKVPLP